MATFLLYVISTAVFTVALQYLVSAILMFYKRRKIRKMLEEVYGIGGTALDKSKKSHLEVVKDDKKEEE